MQNLAHQLTSVKPSRDEILDFLNLIHTHAASLVKGVDSPGVMQLVSIYPSQNETVSIARFAIGDVSAMADLAFASSAAGHNVYLESRCVRHDLRPRERGNINDTTFVFALVIDIDSDRGKSGGETIPASIAVRTSPGNSHRWIFFDRPVAYGEAQELGARLRAVSGADLCTGNIATPFRVAGTPTYPTPNKFARGRFTEPTWIITRHPYMVSPDALRLTLPELPTMAPSESNDDWPEIIQADDLKLIESALWAIPNRGTGLDYDQWFQVVCAMRWASRRAPSRDIAMELAIMCNAWSQQSIKYHRHTMVKVWRALRERHSGKMITLGSLFLMATKSGWISPQTSLARVMLVTKEWEEKTLDEVGNLLLGK